MISLMDRPELGYYRIEGIVGCGRTGIVYLATDSRNGRAVALKVLREDVSIDPVYRERFRREGSLLAGLQHPHVMPIYGMGEIDGELYIAARLVSIFRRGSDGRRPVFGDNALLQTDPHWRDHLLFYEYFHGDTGAGLGASHQTGWTALVAPLLEAGVGSRKSGERVTER